MMDFPFRSIHIAGTNGKGSTATYIGNIIRAAGYSCGVYTSPHVVSPTERINVNGVNIPAGDLERLLRKHSDGATFFHAYTAAAFEWFTKNKVDFAVVETGLGGRLDPTNEITPQIGVLTSIGLDHMDVLGNDIAQIAKEKCGIIKTGMHMITCMQKEEVMRIITEACRSKGCKLTVVTDDDIAIGGKSLNGQSFDLNLNGSIYKGLFIQMLGLHQPVNAALAAAACLKLGIGEEAVRIGLSEAKIESRFEIVPGDPPIILDGAHNEDSAKELEKTIRLYFKGKKSVLLTAVMNDKDKKGIMRIFASFATQAITVKADEVRGADSETLAKMLNECGVQAKSAGDIRQALNEAIKLAKQKNAILIISGSFYLTGKVKTLLAMN